MFIENHNKTVLDSSRVSWRLGFHYLTIHLTIHETRNKDDRKWHLSLWRKILWGTRHLKFNELVILYDKFTSPKRFHKITFVFLLALHGNPFWYICSFSSAPPASIRFMFDSVTKTNLSQFIGIEITVFLNIELSKHNYL